MDTTFGVLAKDPAAWEAFTSTFAAYFPGIPLNADSPEAKSTTIKDMLGMIPVSPDGFTEAVELVLSEANELSGRRRPLGEQGERPLSPSPE